MNRLIRVVFLLTLVSVIVSCSITKEANFNQEYVDYYKNQYRVEIPEAYELVNIMVALTDVGQIDSNMVEMTTSYYKDVMEHFSAYENHKQIRKMNRRIKKTKNFMTYMYYYFYRWNALGYDINNEAKIYHRGMIPQTKFLWLRDPIARNKKHINDFIEKSDFRKFYQNHQAYYDSVTNIYKESIPMAKMVNWLSEKFPEISYDSYKVICSPLVNGSHYTERYHDTSMSQTIMSVCPVTISNRYNEEVNEINNSRIVFTEIDHNFVNLVSDKYKEQIEKVFKDLYFWKDRSFSSSAYKTPYNVFNEYMTWALFSLYSLDNYNKEDCEVAIKRMENSMENGRGFIRFSEFNKKLIELYKQQETFDIELIYEEILTWCEKEYHKNKKE